MCWAFSTIPRPRMSPSGSTLRGRRAAALIQAIAEGRNAARRR